jgi:signal transduction histidine kinase
MGTQQLRVLREVPRPLRLRGAYTLWLALTIGAIGLFSAGLPFSVDKLALGLTGYEAILLVLEIVFSCICFAAGLVLLFALPGVTMAIFLSAMLILLGAATPSMTEDLRQAVPALAPAVYALRTASLISFLITFYVFPDGRFVPGWSRAAAVGWTLANIAWAIFPALPYNTIHGATWRATPLASFLVALAWVATGVAAQIVRYCRMQEPGARRQIRWTALGLLAAALSFGSYYLIYVIAIRLPWIVNNASLYFFLTVPLRTLLATLLLAAFPVCVLIAMLRHRLWVREGLFNAAVASLGLTLGVSVIYALTIAGVGALFAGRSAFTIALIGALAAALYAARQTSRALQLAADLQLARERLVTSREAERRRLRRDLHDGIGPTLAALTLKLDAARADIDDEPALAKRQLHELRGEVQSALAEVRRIAQALRPAALDDVGLVEALRSQALAFASANLHIHVVADELPELPAAVEAAAYYIVREALTNVARHAGARQCTVAVRHTRELEIRVCDDGCGIPTRYTPGVGLVAMRERADELGGVMNVQSSDAGTELVVRLPLRYSPNEASVG